jgi:hypothetical protein
MTMARSTRVPDPLGLRKRVGQVVGAVPGVRRSQPQSAAAKAVSGLREAAESIGDRLSGGPAKRSAAAKKGVRTRNAKSRARSASAKKGAATRARKR